MASLKKRRGRKAKPYVCYWNNETIDGLYLCPDGRWRINATGEKFTEKNPKQAVARFRPWQAQQRGDQQLFPIPFGRFETLGPVPDAPVDDMAAVEAVLRHEFDPGDHQTDKDDSLTLRVPTTADPIRLLRAIPIDAYFTCVADDIIHRPKFMAEGTGIEQLGYLLSLEKPEPSPSLQEVGEYFLAKKEGKMSADWFSKCKAHWKEFSESVGVSTVREVTRQHVEDYGEMVAEEVRDNGFQPTYTRQRLEVIRSVANFPLKKLKWEADCRRLHTRLSILDKPAANPAAPNPMKPKVYRALLEGADDFMRAALLMALNCCMYAGEVVTVRWSELDFERRTFVSARKKTGVVRVGVLWPKTIEALSKLPRVSDSVFLTIITRVQHTDIQ